jgi:putative FmdB family regulatory protein
LPIYVYRCEQCGAVIERRQSFKEDPLTECEACQGRLQRVLQPVGIIFRGSGFYSTDYRPGGAKAANGATEKSESGASSESSKEIDSTTSKPSSDKPSGESKSSTSKDTSSSSTSSS